MCEKHPSKKQLNLTPPKYNLINNTIVCNIVGKTHNHITKNVKTSEVQNLKILVRTKNVIYITYNRNILFSQKALFDVHIIYTVTNLKMLCI